MIYRIINIRKKEILFFVLLLICLLAACDNSKEHLTQVPFSSDFVGGKEGGAGMQTPVYRDTQGNPLGYY